MESTLSPILPATPLALAPNPDVIREIAPRTLRSLFQLRIILCVLAAGLAAAKAILSPPFSTFIVEVISDPSAIAWVSSWVRAINMIASGLLAVTLALVVASFITQTRVQRQVSRAVKGLSAPPVADGDETVI